MRLLKRALALGAALAFAFPSLSNAQISINGRGGTTINARRDAYATRYPYSRTVPDRKNVHYINNAGFRHRLIEDVFKMAGDLGVTLVRLKWFWATIEPTDNAFDWDGNASGQGDYDFMVQVAHDNHVMIVVEYGNSPSWANGGNATNEGPPDDPHMAAYGSYIQTLVTRYKPNGTFAQSQGWAATDRVIYAVEVFNEPNNDTDDGSNNDTGWSVWDGNSYEYANEPVRWAAMVNQTITSAHAGDSGVLVVSGPLCTSGAGGCGGATLYTTYLDSAITGGLNQPDAFGMNGYYTTSTSVDDIFNDPSKGLNNTMANIRSRTKSAWGSAQDTMGIWCMECGSANVGCGNSQTTQANLVELFYQQDNALDIWRLDGKRFVDRMFWRLLEDTAVLDDQLDLSGNTSYGGLIMEDLVYPAPEAETAVCNNDDPTHLNTNGQKKRAYNRFKISVPSIP